MGTIFLKETEFRFLISLIEDQKKGNEIYFMCSVASSGTVVVVLLMRLSKKCFITEYKVCREAIRNKKSFKKLNSLCMSW